MRKKIIGVILICTSTISKAQPETSNWLTVQLPVSINTHWQWLNEYSYRTLGGSLSLYQLFLRTGTRYSFNSKWSVAVSYDQVITRSSLQKTNHSYTNESRIWQEISNSASLHKNYFLQNRLRVEERFFDAFTGKPVHEAVRFRHRLGILKKVNEHWSLFLSNEYLEQLEKGRFSFNQDRLFLNTGYQLNSNVQIQTGYYFVIRPEGEKQHVAALTFQKRFSFHERKQRS